MEQVVFSNPSLEGESHGSDVRFSSLPSSWSIGGEGSCHPRMADDSQSFLHTAWSPLHLLESPDPS